MLAPQRVSVATLRRLTPIGQLSPEAFHELASKATIRRVSAGSRLFAANDRDDWTIYLLDGAVELATDGRCSETMIGGSAVAEMPIAPQQPRRATAVARTNIEVLRVPSSLLEVLTQPPRSANYELEEIYEDDAEVANRLLYLVYQDFVTDKLELPILPDIALRIRKAMENPEVKIEQIVSIVTADPAIAVRLLQVANSAAYRGVSPFDNCRAAIVRLGLSTTREIVSSIALKALFRTSSALLAQRMTELWRRSTHVAAISALLAKRTRKLNPDRALLAGLVHDIGALSVLKRAESHAELRSDPAQLDLAVAKLGGQIGAMILRKWDFADDVVAATLAAGDWERKGGAEPDCSDVVIVAQILSYIGTSHASKIPPLPTLPAFKKLGLGGMSPQECLGIIDEAGDAITDLHRSLTG